MDTKEAKQYLINIKCCRFKLILLEKVIIFSISSK